MVYSRCPLIPQKSVFVYGMWWQGIDWYTIQGVFLTLLSVFWIGSGSTITMTRIEQLLKMNKLMSKNLKVQNVKMFLFLVSVYNLNRIF